jgi:hypothetical protein
MDEHALSFLVREVFKNKFVHLSLPYISKVNDFVKNKLLKFHSYNMMFKY